MSIEEGRQAPEFALRDQDGEVVALSDLKGKRVVLYFYPKDDTPGCTAQACGIRDQFPAFEARDAVVLGVSPDDPKSHRKFREKYCLPFTLLADTEHEAAEAYGVWGPKKMYGREFMGVTRTTFVIDEEGRIERVFREVSPAEHAQELLQVLGG